MQLNNKQIKWLRGQAHSLKPVVMVGKGNLSEGVLKEADISLEHHQLIKIKAQCDDREEFKEICEELVAHTEGTLVATIGRTLVLYRKPRNPATVVKIKIA